MAGSIGIRPFKWRWPPLLRLHQLVWRQCETVGGSLEEPGFVFRVVIYASTPSNSGGSGDFGCLLSKCCLKVFGSGIWDCKKGTIHMLQGTGKDLLASVILTLHTRQVNTRAALAAVFWSWPLAFFSSACFLAFFCWDWIFWCPRAILTKPEKEKIFTHTQQYCMDIYYCWHTSTINKSQ